MQSNAHGANHIFQSALFYQGFYLKYMNEFKSFGVRAEGLANGPVIM
jgi:hypothetical protein